MVTAAMKLEAGQVVWYSHLFKNFPQFVVMHTDSFSNESTLCMRWPKYWSFSFSIIPSKEISGLISFRMDWLDLLAVQGTLKSLLQHRSSIASILQRSAFFTVQLSHPYMTTGIVMLSVVHHQLPELAQTHGHRVGDAIQPSHPLSSLPPPAFNLSQNQGSFQ